MAHLKSDLRPCCKDCIYLGYYDDHKASWYYCSFLGDAYDSIANKQVDYVITTVLEKWPGDFFPTFHKVFASDVCKQFVNIENLISVVDSNFAGVYKDALLFVLNHYK